MSDDRPQAPAPVPRTGPEMKDTDHDDRLIQLLRRVIRFTVRVLAVLMTAVICWGVLDVIYVLYSRILAPGKPVGLLEISDILATFGAFMAVLIAIEIFFNIVLYLRSDHIHIKVVLATALMAIARKVIVLDFKDMTPPFVFGTAAVVLALGVVYWLVVVKRADHVLPREPDDVPLRKEPP